MNPALSVIIFTTFSGMGYGLFIWLSANIIMDQRLLMMKSLLALVFHLYWLRSVLFPRRRILEGLSVHGGHSVNGELRGLAEKGSWLF